MKQLTSRTLTCQVIKPRLLARFPDSGQLARHPRTLSDSFEAQLKNSRTGVHWVILVFLLNMRVNAWLVNVEQLTFTR